MESIKQFNALNGAQVSRQEIERIIDLAKNEEQTEVYNRLQPVLNYNTDEKFNFEIENPAVEVVPKSLLHGLHYEDFEDSTGLAKPVAPSEVYDLITNKMIEMIKNANEKYKKKWKGKEYGTGYTIPFNFVTKKRYRGVNVLMLTKLEPLENPFFLTFKQVNDLKGKVKKGAKGHEVIYFTKIWKTEDRSKDLKFSSYDKSKVETFATENGIDNDLGVIPMLKYYHVYNGKDIEGIDFKLDQFKIGFIDVEKPSDEKNKMAIPEAIIKNYPSPQPKLRFGGDRAFFRSGGVGLVQMPYLSDFDTVQDYYRTLLHEYSHSTGIESRLNRNMSGSFGSKPYAFEELVAELGATFLSAEAGIIWHNNNNHAAYLKSWNSVLTYLKDDNKFIMKASTLAQKVADYILQFDTDGNPLYFKDIVEETAKIEVKKARQLKAKKVKPVVKEIPKIKKKPIKITDITVGKTFLLENKEEINILKLFTENKDETWVEYLRANKSSENEINTLKLFLNRLNAVEVEKSLDKFDEKENAKAIVKQYKNRNKKTDKSLSFNLDEINPIPFSEKPKSVSVETAIKNVLSLPKFKGIKPLIATLVYNKFKNETDLYDSELAVNLTSNYELSILKNDSILHIFYSINEEITLTQLGLEFIVSVKNRLESLRNQKNNYALFPNLSKPKKKAPNKPLNGIIDNVLGNMIASSVLGEPVEEKKQNAPAGSLAHRLQNKGNEVREYYSIPNKDISDFFGKIEKKTKESVAITITGGQGSMKTRLCFQIMNAFAQNYKVGHASIEEHPESGLYEDKIHQYLNEKALSNISAPEISTIDDVHKLVRENDVIIIDSFSKLQEMQKGIELDKDFRKAYDGKLFIIIYQQTTDGKMRGGSKSQFDGDIICFVQKESNYKENYCYQDKNRYQKTNLEDLKFNIFSGKLLQPATTEVQPVPEIETPVANHQFNFIVK